MMATPVSIGSCRSSGSGGSGSNVGTRRRVISFVLAAFSLTLPHTPPRRDAQGTDKLAWVKALKLLVSGGYPGDYKKGISIKNLDKIKGSLVFHAGTKQSGDEVLTDGGRVIAVTTMAMDFEAAVEKSVKNAAKIKFAGRYFRTDIGKDLV